MTLNLKENAVCVWDFTMFLPENQGEEAVRQRLKKCLREYGKKWSFQLEKTPTTDRLHYQGRVSLKLKTRLPGVANIFSTVQSAHLSPTSRANQDNMFYTMKTETRVLGPWTDQDPYVPVQVSSITMLLPWQEKIILRSQHVRPLDRTVDIIVDTGGNIGKSVLTNYMSVHHGAMDFPLIESHKDILQNAYGMLAGQPEDITPVFIIDLPRAIRKDRVAFIFAAIETLKNGRCADQRYTYRSKRFNTPYIIVFTNERPNPEWLSPDRWTFLTVGDDLDLREESN